MNLQCFVKIGKRYDTRSTHRMQREKPNPALARSINGRSYKGLGGFLSTGPTTTSVRPSYSEAHPFVRKVVAKKAASKKKGVLKATRQSFTGYRPKTQAKVRFPTKPWKNLQH